MSTCLCVPFPNLTTWLPVVSVCVWLSTFLSVYLCTEPMYGCRNDFDWSYGVVCRLCDMYNNKHLSLRLIWIVNWLISRIRLPTIWPSGTVDRAADIPSIRGRQFHLNDVVSTIDVYMLFTPFQNVCVVNGCFRISHKFNHYQP